MVDPDRLATAERHLLQLDLVPAMREVGDDGLRNGLLDLQYAIERQQTGLLGRLLRVHTAVEQAMDEMGMADRLIMSAHHPERHYRAAILDQRAGDDRMERQFARRDRVWVMRDRTETSAAIVQQHTALRREDPCSKRREQRIDERAGVAVAVDDTEVHCVLVLELGPARSRHCMV